jgi:hypothetical protein
MTDVIQHLNWAIDTIRDQLKFGRDELGAAKAREMRAKGAMLAAVKELQKKDETIAALEKELFNCYNHLCGSTDYNWPGRYPMAVELAKKGKDKHE